MNAQLKVITESVITRPEYDNTFLGFEADWIEANKVMLRKWWDTLQAVADDDCREPESSFGLFCGCQHELQISVRDEFKNTLRQWE